MKLPTIAVTDALVSDSFQTTVNQSFFQKKHYEKIIFCMLTHCIQESECDNIMDSV